MTVAYAPPPAVLTGGGGYAPAPTALRWAPPVLSNPTTIQLTNTANGRRAIMDPLKDYVVYLPSNEPISVSDGVELNGGRNVVVIGGEIKFPVNYGTATGNRAFWIKGNTAQSTGRIVHVEGVRIGGTLLEGFNIDDQDEPGLTVQLQNIDCADQLQGSADGNHADFVQTWNGPTNFRMDRCYAKTGYQGLFFNPTEFGPQTLGTYEIRRTYIEGTESSGALLYIVTGASSADRPTVITSDVKLRPNPTKTFPNQVIFESTDYWGTGVSQAPIGQTKPCTGNPGRDYVSPGYEAA